MAVGVGCFRWTVLWGPDPWAGLLDGDFVHAATVEKARIVLCALYFVLCALCFVLCAFCALKPSTKYQVPSTKYQAQSTKLKARLAQKSCLRHKNNFANVLP